MRLRFGAAMGLWRGSSAEAHTPGAAADLTPLWARRAAVFFLGNSTGGSGSQPCAVPGDRGSYRHGLLGVQG